MIAIADRSQNLRCSIRPSACSLLTTIAALSMLLLVARLQYLQEAVEMHPMLHDVNNNNKRVSFLSSFYIHLSTADALGSTR